MANKEPIREKRKAEHLCIQCGCQDERTLSGKVRCAKCEQTSRENAKQRERYLHSLKRCMHCGSQDAYTLAGRRYCAECSEKFRESNRILYQRNKELRSKQWSERYNQRKAAGICVKCGKHSAAPGRTRCAACLAKDRQRETANRGVPVTKLDGYCRWCGSPLDGAIKTNGLPSSLCSACYQHYCETHAKQMRDTRNHPWRIDREAMYRRSRNAER